MELRQKPRIGVVSRALCLPDVYNLAREVGYLIGSKGAILICGGRGGVMEASAKGAREAGGITIGILPGASASEANAYIDIPIVTDLGNARNAINAASDSSVSATSESAGAFLPVAKI